MRLIDTYLEVNHLLSKAKDDTYSALSGDDAENLLSVIGNLLDSINNIYNKLEKELDEEAIMKVKRQEFKVGDRVKTVSGDAYDGRIGVVNGCDEFTGIYNVKFDDKDIPLLFASAELQLLEEKEEQQEEDKEVIWKDAKKESPEEEGYYWTYDELVGEEEVSCYSLRHGWELKVDYFYPVRIRQPKLLLPVDFLLDNAEQDTVRILEPCGFCKKDFVKMSCAEAVHCYNADCGAMGPIDDPTGEKWNSLMKKIKLKFVKEETLFDRL